MKPSQLRSHSRNDEIYGVVYADADLMESIKKVGILEPLIITWDKRIISGHRRWKAALALKIADVAVIEFPSRDELDILEALIEANCNRIKTNVMIAREAQTLLFVEEQRAKDRQQKAGGDKKSAEFQESLGVTLPQAIPAEKPKRAPKSTEVVGKKLGVSGSNIRKSTQVVDVIDQLRDNGELEMARELSNTLNKSVDAAHKKAKASGYIAPRVARSKAQAITKHITLPEWHKLTPAAQQDIIARKGTLGFNKQSTASIEWAAWSWNPITGCKHGCDYCYARDIAHRFYGGYGFTPTLHPERLNAPQQRKPPTGAGNTAQMNVFTVSMGDLFGEWVPKEWIDLVLEQVRQSPQWNFIMLTKNPQRLLEFSPFPVNAWIGATVDKQARVKPAQDVFPNITAGVRFLSCEPMLEELHFDSLSMFDWVIIGGASESKDPVTPAFFPPRKWIYGLESLAVQSGCKVYEKSNLWQRIRQFPG
jgi:protein gp37/ParB-like chromosome segregation protein Spo0J